MEAMRIQPSGYEGPTGIVGVLASLLREKGCEVVSLWAGLPHYITAAPNPRGALALVQKAGQYLDVRLDEEPLALFEYELPPELLADARRPPCFEARASFASDRRVVDS